MDMSAPWNSYAAVDAVRRAIEIDNDWDVAEGEDKFHFYVMRAAQNVGKFPPFSEDESALNSYLLHRMAGKRLCDYAWRLLAQSESGQ